MRKLCIYFLLFTCFKNAPAQWLPSFNTQHQQIIKVLSAPTDSVCWFITNMDSLYKTADAGQTWTKQPPSPPSFVPSGLFVLNSSIAFKSGNGSLYKTITGGSSWSLVFSGTASQPPAIWMKNSTEGVLTYSGLLYKTTDGGVTWVTAGITQPPFIPINSIGKGNIFCLGDSIWLALQGHGVAYSPNFGNSWILAANTVMSFSSPPHISFSSSYLGMAIRSNSSQVYITRDGCNTWVAADNSLGLNEDVLVNGPHCWYIPSPADHFYIKYSTDSGSTWVQQLTDAAGFEVLDKARNGNRLWAGTTNGHIYTYIDSVAPAQINYVFNGSGNWSLAANWLNNTVPPLPLHAGISIFINPAVNGVCIADIPLDIPNGVLFTVAEGARLIIQ